MRVRASASTRAAADVALDGRVRSGTSSLKARIMCSRGATTASTSMLSEMPRPRTFDPQTSVVSCERAAAKATARSETRALTYRGPLLYRLR